jgi:hypothetical protein
MGLHTHMYINYHCVYLQMMLRTLKRYVKPKNVERKFAVSMNELKMIIMCVSRLSKRHPRM